MLIGEMFTTKDEVLRVVFELPEILLDIPDRLKTQTLYSDAFEICERCFYYIPEVMRTQKMYAVMVSEKALKESEIPEKSKREDFYRVLTFKKPMQLSNVPPPFITNEMCVYSVDADARNFRYVPYEKRTKELCRVAIEKYPKNLPFIPKQHLSSEQTRKALLSDLSLFKFTQEDSWTDEICAYAVANEFIDISLVPEKYKTAFFYTCLMSIDFTSFKDDIPNHYRETDYYIRCIEDNYLRFSDIVSLPNENNIDKAKIYRVAFEYQPWFFKHIPEQYKTAQMCKSIFDRDVTTFHDVPLIHRTENMYIEAIGSRFPNISIPKKYNNQRFYDRLVAVRPSNIQYVPIQFRTYSMCKIAVNSEPRLFSFVPPDLRNYKIYALTIDFDSGYIDEQIDKIPTNIKTIHFYEALINLDIEFFRYIPDEFKSQSMCKRAIIQDLYNFRYVNEKYRSLDFLLYILNCLRKSSAAEDRVIEAQYFEQHGLPELIDQFSPKNDVDWKCLVEHYPEIIKHITFYDKAENKALDFKAQELNVDEELYSQLAHIAVSKCSKNLEYIKKNVQTSALCELAVKADPRNFAFIWDDTIKNDALCLRYFELGGDDLSLIPTNKQTAEILEMALNASCRNFAFIQKDRLKSNALCLRYFELGGDDLSLVPTNKQTSEICELAVNANYKNFVLIQNDRLKSNALCLRYFELGGDDLSLIPTNKRTSEICELAVNANYKNFALIQDDKLKSGSLCLRYFELGGADLSLIPFNKRTINLCKLACETNCENIYLVPTEILEKTDMSEQRIANKVYTELTKNVIKYVKRGNLPESNGIEELLFDAILEKYDCLMDYTAEEFRDSQYDYIFEHGGEMETCKLGSLDNITVSDNCYTLHTSFEVLLTYDGQEEYDSGDNNFPGERAVQHLKINETKTIDAGIHIEEASIRFTLADSYQSESVYDTTD